MNGNSNERRVGTYGERSLGEASVTERNTAQPHSFTADNRTSMIIRGVTEVISFDETGVLLTTTCGQLNLEGTGLHVTVLNTKDGIVEVTGKLCGLFYEDVDSPAYGGSDKHKGKRGLFGRLLS